MQYVLIKEEGPSHNKLFAIEVRVNGICYGTGIATSKKDAEQNAAKKALDKLAN